MVMKVDITFIDDLNTNGTPITPNKKGVGGVHVGVEQIDRLQTEGQAVSVDGLVHTTVDIGTGFLNFLRQLHDVNDYNASNKYNALIVNENGSATEWNDGSKIPAVKAINDNTSVTVKPNTMVKRDNGGNVWANAIVLNSKEANELQLINAGRAVGGIIGGINSKWYKDTLEFGHERSGDVNSNGFSVKMNGANIFHVGKQGDGFVTGYMQSNGAMIGEIVTPAYAIYKSDGVSTGKIKIQIPDRAYRSNTMFTIEVDMYDYNEKAGAKFIIQGYNYAGTTQSWYNTNAIQIGGNKPYTVRFCLDAANRKQFITIGEPNETWDYLSFAITKMVIHKGNKTLWVRDWSLSVNADEHEGVQKSLQCYMMTTASKENSMALRDHTGALRATDFIIPAKQSNEVSLFNNHSFSTGAVIGGVSAKWYNDYMEFGLARGDSLAAQGFKARLNGVDLATFKMDGAFFNSRVYTNGGVFDGRLPNNKQVLNVSVTDNTTLYLGNPSNIARITLETKAGGTIYHNGFQVFTKGFKPNSTDVGLNNVPNLVHSFGSAANTVPIRGTDGDLVASSYYTADLNSASNAKGLFFKDKNGAICGGAGIYSSNGGVTDGNKYAYLSVNGQPWNVGGTLKVWKGRVTFDDVELMKTITDQFFNFSNLNSIMPAHYYHNTYAETGNVYIHAYPTSTYDKPTALKLRTKKDATNYTEYSFGATNFIVPNQIEVKGQIDSNLTSATTYSMIRLPSYAAGSKTYLRKYRGGASDTIWHETVQGSIIRWATGNSDDIEQFRIASGRVATTGRLILNGSTTADPMITLERTNLSGNVSIKFQGQSLVRLFGLRTDGKFGFTTGNHDLSGADAGWFYTTVNKPNNVDVGLSNVPNTVHTINATANTVALRDTSGYLTAGTFKLNQLNPTSNAKGLWFYDKNMKQRGGVGVYSQNGGVSLDDRNTSAFLSIFERPWETGIDRGTLQVFYNGMRFNNYEVLHHGNINDMGFLKAVTDQAFNFTTTSGNMSPHYFHNLYSPTDQTVYIHAYPTEHANVEHTRFRFRVKESKTSYKELTFTDSGFTIPVTTYIGHAIKDIRLPTSNQQIINALGTENNTTVYVGNPTNVNYITLETKVNGRVKRNGYYIYDTQFRPTKDDVGLNHVPNTVHTTAATANTVAVRSGNGDIDARLFKSTYANQATIDGALAFRVNSGSDNYIRFCSDKTAIKNWLGVSSLGDTNLNQTATTYYEVTDLNWWGDSGIGKSQMLQSTSLGIPAGSGYAFKIGARDVQKGHGWLYMDNFGTGGRLWYGANNNGNEAPNWAGLYSTTYKPNSTDVGLNNVPNTVHTAEATANTVVLRDASGRIKNTSVTASFNGNYGGTINLNTITPLVHGFEYKSNVNQDSANIFPRNSNANGVLTFSTHGGEYYQQLGFSSNGAMYYRPSRTTTWGKVFTEKNNPTKNDVGLNHVPNTVHTAAAAASTVAVRNGDAELYAKNMVVQLGVKSASEWTDGNRFMMKIGVYNNSLGDKLELRPVGAGSANVDAGIDLWTHRIDLNKNTVAKQNMEIQGLTYAKEAEFYQGSTVHHMIPDGGFYKSGESKGMIKIKLPQNAIRTSGMMAMGITIFNYAANTTIKCFVASYNYVGTGTGAKSWHNTTFTQVGGNKSLKLEMVTDYTTNEQYLLFSTIDGSNTWLYLGVSIDYLNLYNRDAGDRRGLTGWETSVITAKPATANADETVYGFGNTTAAIGNTMAMRDGIGRIYAKGFVLSADEQNETTLFNRRDDGFKTGDIVGGITSKWYNNTMEFGLSRDGSTGTEGIKAKVNNVALMRLHPNDVFFYKPLHVNSVIKDDRLPSNNQQILNVGANGDNSTVYVGNPQNIGAVIIETKANGRLKRNAYSVFDTQFKPNSTDVGLNNVPNLVHSFGSAANTVPLRGTGGELIATSYYTADLSSSSNAKGLFFKDKNGAICGGTGIYSSNGGVTDANKYAYLSVNGEPWNVGTGGTLKVWKGRVTFDDVELLKATTNVNFNFTSTAAVMPSHYYHNTYSTTNNVYVHAYPTSTHAKPTALVVRTKKDANNYTEYTFGSTRARMPVALTLTGEIDQEITTATTYSMIRLPSYAAGSKTYLRKYRGGASDTIWHETVQGSILRWATGNSDDVEQFRIASGRVATTGRLILNGSTTADPMITLERTNLAGNVSIKFQGQSTVRLFGMNTSGQFAFTTGDHNIDGGSKFYTEAFKPTKNDVGLNNVPNTTHTTAATGNTVVLRDGNANISAKSFIINNNTGYYGKDTSGNTKLLVSMDSANKMVLGDGARTIIARVNSVFQINAQNESSASTVALYGKSAWLGFYDFKSGTRKGWVGKGSNDSNDIMVSNDTSGANINLNGASKNITITANVTTFTGNFTINSDKRIKDNIKKITNAMQTLRGVNGVTYTRTDLDDNNKQYAGFIAQDLKQVYPIAVDVREANGFEDFHSVDYVEVIPLAVEAIKDVDNELQQVKDELQKTKDELNEMRQLMAQMMEKLNSL